MNAELRTALDRQAQAHMQEIAALEAILEAEVQLQDRLRQRKQWVQARIAYRQGLIRQMEQLRRQAERGEAQMQEAVQEKVAEVEAAMGQERQDYRRQLAELDQKINVALSGVMGRLRLVAGFAAGDETPNPDRTAEGSA